MPVHANATAGPALTRRRPVRVFLAESGRPGVIVEHGRTSRIFELPGDPRTADYVHGRFG